MRKWKADCSLIKKIKSDEGITLVELLAAISILSIVILLAGSIHLFGQKQFIQQSDSASQANDMTYALSEMSRELRRYSPADLTLSENEKQIFKNEDKILYEIEGNKLIKNDSTTLVGNIKGEFSFIPDKTSKEGIYILLEDIEHGKKYETKIHFRGGS